jgi:hypothetical protein
VRSDWIDLEQELTLLDPIAFVDGGSTTRPDVSALMFTSRFG